MRVIGLCGVGTSGKDTAAAGLTSRDWRRVSFADGLREFALAIDPIVNIPGAYRLSDLVDAVGWTEAKQHEEVRRLLQVIGTNAGREIIGEGVWIDIAGHKVLDAIEDGYGVVLTDVRFANEVSFVRDEFGGAIVRIVRPGVGPVNGHISETAIDDIEPDFTIVNDGTVEELQAKLVEIAASLEKAAA